MTTEPAIVLNWKSVPPLLRTDEVAELLRLSPAYVRSLCASGQLAAVRLGPRGDWRVPKAALEKFVEAAD